MENKFRILIVDDENEILATYRDFLVKRGFQVDIAHNGVEGLEKLRSNQFEVAIVDIKMPKMGGIELTQKVQAEGIDTDIIILTGHGDKDDAVAAINADVRAWFEKSGIKMNELLAKVKELVEVMPLTDIRRILSAIPNEG